MGEELRSVRKREHVLRIAVADLCSAHTAACVSYTHAKGSGFSVLIIISTRTLSAIRLHKGNTSISCNILILYIALHVLGELQRVHRYQLRNQRPCFLIRVAIRRAVGSTSLDKVTTRQRERASRAENERLI
jgi:hypothetical protein